MYYIVDIYDKTKKYLTKKFENLMLKFRPI